MASVPDVHPSVLIIAEQSEPPLRRLKVEILDQRASYLHICHDDTLTWGAALEAMLEGEMSLDEGPKGPNDRVFKEPSY